MGDVRIDWQRIEKPDAQFDQALLRSLILRIAAKDKEALKTLYQRSGGKLLGITQLLIADRPAAENALVEIFVCIWNEAPRFEAAGVCPSQWLFLIVRAVAQSRAAPYPNSSSQPFIGPVEWAGILEPSIARSTT